MSTGNSGRTWSYTKLLVLKKTAFPDRNMNLIVENLCFLVFVEINIISIETAKSK